MFVLERFDIYGRGFYELSRMLMRKNIYINNDVRKDWPIFNSLLSVLSGDEIGVPKDHFFLKIVIKCF